MQNNEITKKMIYFHKSAFESGFNSITMLQEQTSKLVDNILNQTPWMPAQAKSLINEWTGMYKKGTMNFKEVADQNYAKLEEVLTSGFQAFQPKTKN